MNRVYTIDDIADKVEAAFVKDASLPQAKRTYATILVDALRECAISIEEGMERIAVFCRGGKDSHGAEVVNA